MQQGANSQDREISRLSFLTRSAKHRQQSQESDRCWAFLIAIIFSLAPAALHTLWINFFESHLVWHFVKEWATRQVPSIRLGDAAPLPADGIKPTFTERPVIRQSEDGNKIIFECRLVGDPQPSIAWLVKNFLFELWLFRSNVNKQSK